MLRVAYLGVWVGTQGRFMDKADGLLQEGQLKVQVLRRALVGAAASVGGDLQQPQEIARRFGVEKTLAWRISRAVREEDAWQALDHLPGKAGLGIFVEAMTKAGAASDRVAQLRAAVDGFEAFLQARVGDRDTLDMIVTVPPRRSALKRLEAFRKSAFQGNASLLGVRARVQFNVRLLVPSKTEGMLDMAAISGLIDLCRLRPGMPWPVATVRSWGPLPQNVLDKARSLTTTIGVMDGENTISPVMTGHCRPQGLKLRTVKESEGVYRHMLEGGDLGSAGSVDVFSGWYSAAEASVVESTPGELGEHAVILCTPAEELIQDLLVHEDLGIVMDPTARVYSMFPGAPQYPGPCSEHTLLPVPTELLSLGRNLPDTPTPTLAYEEMLGLAAERLGSDLGRFRVYRYRLAYPPIPSICILSHPLRKA